MKCITIRLRKRMLLIPVGVVAAVALAIGIGSHLKGQKTQYCNFPDGYGEHIETTAPSDAIGTGQKIAYLTFDDGPSDETEKILDCLKEKNAKATFFVLGTELDKRPDLYRRIVDEGHVLGLHSFSHEYKSIYQSPESFFQDLNMLKEPLEAIAGQPISAYRFPGGSSNTVHRKFSNVSNFMDTVIEQLTAQGIQYFDWTVSADDSVGSKKSTDYLVNKVVKESLEQETPVILMHDAPGHDTTAAAVPQIIDQLTAQGYTFQSLSESTPCHHQRYN
ncbi:polysaccharide deacetylase family protein [Neobittarella massiliensis]|uniref:Polysaccharide deacetylase n=2 Tax=Oscillospiraceae TaxID=216572 RepID=A0A8J6IFP1_9FIRM|nr:polysaccharide deacetylase family protein [Neobittarella massiliensis]MBC3516290.1 polysaccharide deacetylase [Neobittarella massiliensis]SCJ86874.1 Bifunctional xylanase/deacetylase precursor [uncultured Anaerotruncus sp.]